MLKVMKKLFTIISLAVLGLASTGCDSYLDVNKNVDAPDYIENYQYLAGIESALGNGMYQEIRTAAAPLAQLMATTNTATYANHTYYASSDTGGELWRVAYWLHGMNLENMINESIAAEDWTAAGIGYAIKAYTWDQLTKYHGDIILTQAFEPGRLSHDYDYQKDVYPKIREWAETAIKYLAMEDNAGTVANVAENDLFYKGDKDKWTKFAHGVIVRNLISLSNKTNFVSEYSQQLIDHALLALQSNDDNCAMACPGGEDDALFSAYNNYAGVYRGGFDAYWNSTFAVEIMTGTLPLYDHDSGDKVKRDIDEDAESEERAAYYPYDLNPKQYVADTITTIAGHFDPRVVLKLGTNDGYDYKDIDNADSIKHYRFYGSNFGGSVGPIGTSSNPYGRAGKASSGDVDGKGRWLYRNDAPYILMTAAEIKFELAECYWKRGEKAQALQAMKDGIALDLDFTKLYIKPGSPKENADGSYVFGGALPGGDKIKADVFQKLADEYKSGPYVEGLALNDFTLSHIMLQKIVALYPWGGIELWTDQRKYHYDLNYTGEYPSSGNGYDLTTVDQKWDEDPTKVFKGLYLQPAQVEGRKGKYDVDNGGSPCYRVRPRYNSEYMWNVPGLEALKPISGTAINYHTSIPWFAYPNEVPGV